MSKLLQQLLQSDAGCAVDPILLADQLRKRQIISLDEYQLIKNEKPKSAQQSKLFLDILPAHDEKKTIASLIESAEEQHWEPMRNFLLERVGNQFSDPNRSVIAKVNMVELISTLKEQYINECDIMRQQWSKLIDNGDDYGMNNFIPLEIVTERLHSEETDLVPSYEDLFHFQLLAHAGTVPPGSRIVLEGQPGTGKTTYLHKMAMDWANNDPWLNEQFEIVFIVRLGEVTPNDGLLEALSKNLPCDAKNTLKQMFLNGMLLGKKTLLLLDGYDEFHAINDCPDLKNLMRGKSNTAVQLISTRPTRTRELADRNRLVRTNGFSSEILETLIKRDKSSFLQINEIDKTFLKNPLVFGMYSSVHNNENTELFSLMNTFCDHLFDRHLQLKPKKIDETRKDDLFQFISEVAYHFHSDEPYQSLVDQRLLLDVEEIGLLWHHRKASGLKRSTAEIQKVDPANYSFPHKLFQDFFAAKFANKLLSFGGMKITNYEPNFLYFCSGFSQEFQQSFFNISFGSSNRWDQNTLHRIANPDSIDATYVTNVVATFEELEILGHGKRIARFINIIVEKISRNMKEKELDLQTLVLHTCLFQDWKILTKLPTERLRIIDDRIWDSNAGTTIVAPLSSALREFQCYNSLFSIEFLGPFVQYVITQCNDLPELQELTLLAENNDPWTPVYARDITSLITWVKRNQRLKKLRISIDIRVPIPAFQNFINSIAKQKVSLKLDADRLSMTELNEEYKNFNRQIMKAKNDWHYLDSFQRTMELSEMKACLDEKVSQDASQESKEYVNSFIFYGKGDEGDFMEIYPSQDHKLSCLNPEYRFYFGNLLPPTRKWPKRDYGNLEGIRIALIPGAERYKITAQVDGQDRTIIYPQLTWDIVQMIKNKLESALATVYVLRDKKVDPFNRATGPYFMQQVESVEAFFVVGIHFFVANPPSNAYAETWSKEGAVYELGRVNDICAYVPGSYMKSEHELADERNRFFCIRDVVTRKMEESVELADCIVRKFHEKMSLPLRPAHTAAARLAKEGVFHRNLAYIRASKYPACYCSTCWIDNVDQFKKLATGDYMDIVDCYVDGILDYVASKTMR